MKKKYKLTEEIIEYDGKKLYRIEALKDFAHIRKGDKGGYVESEANLSQYGNCWIDAEAKVYEKAKICGNTLVYGKAVVFGKAIASGEVEIYGDARIYGDTMICNKAKIYGNVIISGHTIIEGDAKISSIADYIVFKNWWSSGRYFTWTRSNNMWSVGCFYGTGKELIKKAYKDSELSGREYERVVNYVESILKDSEK